MKTSQTGRYLRKNRKSWKLRSFSRLRCYASVAGEARHRFGCALPPATLSVPTVIRLGVNPTASPRQSSSLTRAGLLAPPRHLPGLTTSCSIAFAADPGDLGGNARDRPGIETLYEQRARPDPDTWPALAERPACTTGCSQGCRLPVARRRRRRGYAGRRFGRKKEKLPFSLHALSDWS